MKQIFHPYTEWEDWKSGMWRKETSEYELKEMQNIIDFTGDNLRYGKSMLRVINEWPVICENNLSNISINRKAWIGHAACCIEMKYPEYLVRQAWRQLSEKQRELANKQAEIIIKAWERKQKYNPTLHNGKIDAIQMEFQM